MNYFTDLAVAGVPSEVTAGGLYLYKADGTVLVSNFRGLSGSDLYTNLALSVDDQRFYLVTVAGSLDIYDETLTLVTSINPAGSAIRSGYELDGVCVPCRGKVWALAAYNYTEPTPPYTPLPPPDGPGASIYEYLSDGSFSRVVVEYGPGAQSLPSPGRMRVIWSAVKIGNVLYYTANSDEARNTPVGPIFSPGNFPDVDGALHKYDLVAQTDLPDLQPIATAPYTTLTKDASNRLFACIGHAGTPSDDTVQRYAGDVLEATYPGFSSLTGIALDADGTTFWLLDSLGEYRDYVALTGAPAGADFDGGSLQSAISACPVSIPTCPDVPPGPGVTRYTRRVRQFAGPYQLNANVFLSDLEIYLQSGVGLTTGQGSDPVLMVQLSKDSGHTWGPEFTLPMGKIGQYARRARKAGSLGRGRQWVIRVSVSDPVFASFLSCYVNAEEGTS